MPTPSYMMKIQFTSKKDHAWSFGQIAPSGKYLDI